MFVRLAFRRPSSQNPHRGPAWRLEHAS